MDSPRATRTEAHALKLDGEDNISGFLNSQDEKNQNKYDQSHSRRRQGLQAGSPVSGEAIYVAEVDSREAYSPSLSFFFKHKRQTNRMIGWRHLLSVLFFFLSLNPGAV